MTEEDFDKRIGNAKEWHELMKKSWPGTRLDKVELYENKEAKQEEMRNQRGVLKHLTGNREE